MSVSTPIIAQSLAEQAVTRVEDSIVRGEFKPEERIREALLAKDLRISRGVLREAMQRLKARKLSVRTPNIGVQVMDILRRDLDELYDIHEALEAMAARLAAKMMSGEEIAALHVLVESHSQSEGVWHGTDYFQPAGDEDFHVRLVLGSQNRWLIHTLRDEVNSQLRRYGYRSSVRAGRSREALQEHRAIITAIANRDPDAAESAVRRHPANARADITWNKPSTTVLIGGASEYPLH